MQTCICFLIEQQKSNNCKDDLLIKLLTSSRLVMFLTRGHLLRPVPPQHVLPRLRLFSSGTRSSYAGHNKVGVNMYVPTSRAHVCGFSGRK
jgi:hypothetical protein